MKKFTVILLGIVLIQSCGSPEKETKEEVSINSLTEVKIGDDTVKLNPTQRAIQEYAAQLGPTTLISAEDAKNKLGLFKLRKDLEDGVLGNFDFKNYVYGHTFRLDSIQSFMKWIDEYNKAQKPNNRINGLRVYQGSEFYQTDELGSMFIPDVFLMPTINNKNLYDVDVDFPNSGNSGKTKFVDSLLDLERLKVRNLTGGAGILNVSNPCPNLCQ